MSAADSAGCSPLVRQEDTNGVYWRCRDCGELRGHPHAPLCERNNPRTEGES